MFNNAVALNTSVHGALRFSPQESRAFAAHEQLVPMVAAEAQQAAKAHVIVFAAAGAPALPQLLVGLVPGVNAYVGPQGQWLADYVPAQVRNYPFVLAEQPAAGNASEAQRRFTVCVVPDAPHFGVRGEALFAPDGSPAPVLQKVQAVLTQLQKDAEQTQFLVQQLDDLGLLRVQLLPVPHGQGRAAGVQGLRVLDMARFKALAPAQEAALRESGALALVHAHVSSLGNLQGGPLSAAAAAQAVPQRFMGDRLMAQVQPQPGGREFPAGARPFETMGRGGRH